MARALVLLVALLAVGCAGAPGPVVVGSPSPVASQESVAEYARRSVGEQSYGLYYGGKKMGWGRMRNSLGRHDGREAFITEDEVFLRSSSAGQVTTLHIVTRTAYSIEGDGLIVGVAETRKEDGATSTLTARPEGQTLKVETRRGKDVDRRKIPMPGVDLREFLAFKHWLETARQGETFIMTSLEWSEDQVASDDLFTFAGRETIQWAGVATEALKVTMDQRGMKLEALMRPDGFPWKAYAGPVEMRAEDEAIAQRLDKPVDLLAATTVRVKPALKNHPENVTHLVLKVSGVEGFRFPASHRQQVSKSSDGVRLEVFKDFATAYPESLTPEERARYVEATKSIDHDERMKAASRKVIGEETSPIGQAKRLSAWIFRELEKTYSKNTSSASAVFANKAGDCSEHALLFVAMARSLDIPSRITGGLAYYAEGTFGWHAWAEFHDGRQWVSVDPMWDELWVDATHIQMQHAPDDYAWANVAGKMKLELVEEKP